MVILGLGSNVGDRLAILRDALLFIKNIPGLRVTQVSPVYLSDALLTDDAPPSWNLPYLNLAVRCETTLAPLALLEQTKKIEQLLGRIPNQVWAPRPVDIDLLAWDDLILYEDKLHIPHEHLQNRPFALWPLADVAPRWVYPLPNAFQGKTATEIAAQWPSRFSGDAPLHTQQIAQRIDTPRLVGILNITPDSFSDGAVFMNVNAAVEQAYQLVKTGAEIIDIGAEATGPSASTLTAAEEWKRLEPVLIAVLAESSRMLIPPKISVDTRHASTAEKALALGVDWINDVTGLSDPAMSAILAAQTCDIVIMHELGIPASHNRVLPQAENPVTIVYDWAEKNVERLEKQGIAPNRLIIDVGIGFGKNAAQSLELLQQISDFHALQCRLMVGHSRKSFLTQFTELPAPERDVETLAISLYLANQDVDYLRLHNTDFCSRAFKVAKTLSPF